MWGRGRFHNAAVSQQAVATPTVLTTSRPNPGPSRGTRTTNMLDLGNSVVLKGDLSASEDLTIEGRFEGTIMVRGNTLTVGRDAQIEGQILARVATIGGTVHGDVTATEKVEILATGSLDGDIVAPQIAIAEGACFRGNFREEVDVQPGNAEQVLASQSAPAFPRRPETPSTPGPAVTRQHLRQLWPALQQSLELFHESAAVARWQRLAQERGAERERLETALRDSEARHEAQAKEWAKARDEAAKALQAAESQAERLAQEWNAERQTLMASLRSAESRYETSEQERARDRQRQDSPVSLADAF